MIILPDVPYRFACESLSIPSLSDGREFLCFTLFDAMKAQKQKLHDLLPLKRETIYSVRKREREYSLPKCHTDRHKYNLVLCYVDY